MPPRGRGLVVGYAFSGGSCGLIPIRLATFCAAAFDCSGVIGLSGGSGSVIQGAYCCVDGSGIDPLAEGEGLERPRVVDFGFIGCATSWSR